MRFASTAGTSRSSISCPGAVAARTRGARVAGRRRRQPAFARASRARPRRCATILAAMSSRRRSPVPVLDSGVGGRAACEPAVRRSLRPTSCEPCGSSPGFVRTATGSALIELGGTRVICTASAEEGVPRWMAGQQRGWATAEYGMLPASTGERKQRDVRCGRPDGRTVEIQRLVGRSLPGVTSSGSGSARSGSIATCSRPTAYALRRDHRGLCGGRAGAATARVRGRIGGAPATQSVAGVSCGVVAEALDLDYSEDSQAEVDANVVMTGDGGLVEVQATAERTPLSRASLDELLRRPRQGSATAGAARSRGRGGRGAQALAAGDRHRQPAQAERACAAAAAA